MKYCDIDLHSNNCVVVVSDEEDRVVFNQRLPNDLGQIRAVLEPHRKELAGVVIESTYNWYWLVDGLMDAAYRVHLAHPSAIKKYEGLKHSGDLADAAYLAQLLRLGLLAEGYIYPREERGARDLARNRMQLVRYRTAQILSIENILIRQTGARMKGEAVKRLTAEQVDEFERRVLPCGAMVDAGLSYVMSKRKTSQRRGPRPAIHSAVYRRRLRESRLGVIRGWMPQTDSGACGSSDSSCLTRLLQTASTQMQRWRNSGRWTFLRSASGQCTHACVCHAEPYQTRA